MPGTILGPEDTVVNKTHNMFSFPSQGAHILIGDEKKYLCGMPHNGKCYEDKAEKEDW